MKTIYNTYIEVTSQVQADRLKQMCIDNNLPIWEDEIAFNILQGINIFESSCDEFYIIYYDDEDTLPNKTKVTEKQFLKLLQDERVRQNNN